MKWLAWLAWCVLVLGTGSALAAGRSVSYSTWQVSGNVITLRFMLPVSEARRLMGVAVPVLTTDKLKDYLLQHTAVDSASGACAAIDQGYDLGRVDPLAVGPDLYGFELVYRCTDPRQLILRDSVLFAAVPDHVNFARIQTQGAVVQQLFTAAHQQLALPDHGAPSAAGFFAYARIGLVHVLGSADRWCVLLGALLLVQRRRDVGAMVLALAGGYLLSVLVSSSGWVIPRVNVAEAFVGVLVALLGAALMLRNAYSRWASMAAGPGLLLVLAIVSVFLRAPWAAALLLGAGCLCSGLILLSRQHGGAGWSWLLLIAVFAFLDGFAVSALLPPAQLPPRSQLQIVLGFDSGSVLIEALLVAVPTLLLLTVRARRTAIFRPLLDELAAAFLSGVGTFWLVSRLWI